MDFKRLSPTICFVAEAVALIEEHAVPNSTQSRYGKANIFQAWSNPNNDLFCACVDGAHIEDFYTSLDHIILVNTESIDPKKKTLGVSSYLKWRKAIARL
jgi:hypothetical protein